MLLACQGPEASQIQVGSHLIAIQIPEGWEHLDYGSTHHFKRGLAKIAIEDMGPQSVLIEEATAPMLKRLGHDSQRDIASQERVVFNDQEVFVVDTWDRLSHLYRKRFAFVYDGNRVLALHTWFGRYEEMEKALAVMIASVKILKEPPDSTAAMPR
jgi:hypothetical protein